MDILDLCADISKLLLGTVSHNDSILCRLRWFGHVERKDDWVKCCITWEVEGIRPRGRLIKTRWDCVKNDMESLGLSQKDAQSRNKWRRRIKWQPGNPGSPGKMLIKTECACVYVYLVSTAVLAVANTWKNTFSQTLHQFFFFKFLDFLSFAGWWPSCTWWCCSYGAGLAIKRQRV